MGSRPIDEARVLELIPQIARDLGRMADSMEAAEERATALGINPESLGALALWRQEVFTQQTLLGFTDWLAWHQEVKEE